MKLVSSFLNLLHIECYTKLKFTNQYKFLENNNENKNQQIKNIKFKLLQFDKIFTKKSFYAQRTNCKLCL